MDGNSEDVRIGWMRENMSALRAKTEGGWALVLALNFSESLFFRHVNMVATIHAFQFPATGGKDFTEDLAGDRFHHSISATCAFSIDFSLDNTLSVATAIQPSAASRMFARVSSRSSPSEIQPGRPGISARNPPSSAG